MDRQSQDQLDEAAGQEMVYRLQELARCPSCGGNMSGLQHYATCRAGVPAGLGVDTLLSSTRVFITGAMRDTDISKLDYDAFFSPLVLEARARYMDSKRQMPDGSKRDGDNWQRGIPLEVYAKSAWRHHVEFWKLARGYQVMDEKEGSVDIKTAICALMFNLEGYLHEVLRAETSSLDQSSRATKS